MQPPVAKIITEVDEVTGKALTYTRTLISQLSPPVLAEFGLPMALQWLTEQLQQQDLSVSLQVDDNSDVTRGSRAAAVSIHP